MLSSFILLRSYVKEKGKNLATREDIGAITRKVEKVRAEYAERFETLAQQNRLLLEGTRQHHELRLAVPDRRLAAHQEAYALWWKLLGSVYNKNEIGNVVKECEDWWVHNRLYLEPEVAQAFSSAYHAAFYHRDYVEAKLERNQLEENWYSIQDLGETLVKAIQLPSLKEGEYQPIEQDKSKPTKKDV